MFAHSIFVFVTLVSTLQYNLDKGEYSQGRLHLLQLVLMSPIPLPSIPWVALADEVHTSALGTMQNLAQALLIGQQTSDVILLGVGPVWSHGCGLLIPVRTIDAVQRGVRPCTHERSQGAAAGW